MIKISKIEAAERQLDAAIRLFFAEADWIAIHTLAAASGRILRDLAEQRGSSAWDILNGAIRPEKRNEWWRHANKAANFFKHADRDNENLLEEISPEVNDHLIFLNWLLFVDLEKCLTFSMDVFQCWYIAAYPETFVYDRVPILAQFKRLAISVQEDLCREEQLAAWHAILEECPRKRTARPHGKRY